MPVSRKESKGAWPFAVPLIGALLLVACYVVLTEWQDLPRMIGSAISTVR